MRSMMGYTLILCDARTYKNVEINNTKSKYQNNPGRGQEAVSGRNRKRCY